MRELGIRGVIQCRKRVFTTRSDPDAARAPDLVKRDFSAAHPNGLWVTDLTYVPTRTGMAYVCFITDAFSRMIVGWRVAAHMRTDMVLDALEMARQLPPGRSPRRPGDPFGRRIAIHLRALHRAPRRDRGPSEHRDRGRFVRQCPRRGDQRPLQDRVRLRPRHQRLGRRRATSSWPRSRGCTGSTRSASTATAATSRQRSSKQRSTLPNNRPYRGLETNNQSLHQTQGDSPGHNHDLGVRQELLLGLIVGRVNGDLGLRRMGRWMRRRPGCPCSSEQESRQHCQRVPLVGHGFAPPKEDFTKRSDRPLSLPGR